MSYLSKLLFESCACDGIEPLCDVCKKGCPELAKMRELLWRWTEAIEGERVFGPGDHSKLYRQTLKLLEKGE